jgi:hypothetical protein
MNCWLFELLNQNPKVLIISYEFEAIGFTGKRQSQLQLNCIEAIYFPGYGTKIPNHNTQITNNIKITKSNDQNITITYRMSRDILSVLNFKFR